MQYWSNHGNISAQLLLEIGCLSPNNVIYIDRTCKYEAFVVIALLLSSSLVQIGSSPTHIWSFWSTFNSSTFKFYGWYSAYVLSKQVSSLCRFRYFSQLEYSKYTGKIHTYQNK